MGNAAITIHHPTSLQAEYPYLESGKVIHQSAGMIRCEKRDGAAVGVGGVFVFKKIVEESEYTFELKETSEMRAGLNVNATYQITKKAENEQQERVFMK